MYTMTQANEIAVELNEMNLVGMLLDTPKGYFVLNKDGEVLPLGDVV